MLKSGLTLVLSVVLLAGTAFASDYRFVNQEQFKKWLETGKQTVIIDIQPAPAFEKHHFKGAVETGAFPVKSDADKRRLEAVLPKIKASQAEVVIVCPRGGGGAKNTYDFLKEKGVPEARLLILEKGMDGWKYPELSVKGR